MPENLIPLQRALKEVDFAEVVLDLYTEIQEGLSDFGGCSSTAQGLMWIGLPDGRKAQVIIRLSADDDEWIGEPHGKNSVIIDTNED